jgi:MarR family transcriptional regulator, organic hydroperoxide resistance regulator
VSERVTLGEARKQIQVRLEGLGLHHESTLLISDITRVANGIRLSLTNAVLREHDLSWTGFAILWLLWLHGPLETRHAAQAAAISKATLTGVVNTLEQRGYLERIPRSDDRRLVELHLTASGHQFMESVYPSYNQAEKATLEALNDRERAALRNGLEKLVRSLEKD